MVTIQISERALDNVIKQIREAGYDFAYPFEDRPHSQADVDDFEQEVARALLENAISRGDFQLVWGDLAVFEELVEAGMLV